jgi:four helix bundle protein
MFVFETFPVYLKAEEAFIKLNCVFQIKDLDRDLRDQLRRASTSVILNIAEGSGKFSKNDKKNFYLISRGSVNECVAILRIIKLQGKIDEKYYSIIYNYYEEIGRMLSGLINKMLAV